MQSHTCHQILQSAIEHHKYQTFQHFEVSSCFSTLRNNLHAEMGEVGGKMAIYNRSFCFVCFFSLISQTPFKDFVVLEPRQNLNSFFISFSLMQLKMVPQVLINHQHLLSVLCKNYVCRATGQP